MLKEVRHEKFRGLPDLFFSSYPLPFRSVWHILIGFFAGGCGIVAYHFTNGSNNNNVLWCTIPLIAGVLAGYFLALCVTSRGDNDITNTFAGPANNIPGSMPIIDDVKSYGNIKEYGKFLILVCSFTFLYICAFYYALSKFVKDAPTEISPIRPEVSLITGATVGLMVYFAVRYAAYVRMTRFLEQALRLGAPPGVIKSLRDLVYREEQLYEPPGNIFVTVGITATFLGLAFGLISLDISAFVQPVNAAVEEAALDGGNGIAGASPGQLAVSLQSFVGCMGLALGVSMLGVIAAMGAQWLRGHGATKPTDELVAMATPAPLGTP